MTTYNWFAAFVAVNILDAGLTLYALERAASEVNPLMRLAMRVMPAPVALLIVKGARLGDRHRADVPDPARILEVLLAGVAVPQHFEWVDPINPKLPVRVVLVIEPGFGPPHAAGDGIAERLAVVVVGVGLVAEEPGRLGVDVRRVLVEPVIFGGRHTRDVADFLAVADFLPVDGIDDGQDRVEHRRRLLTIVEDALLVLGPVATVAELEITLRLLAPLFDVTKVRPEPLLVGFGDKIAGLEVHHATFQLPDDLPAP